MGDARSVFARADWAAQMADLVTRCPSGRTEIAAAAGQTMANASTPLAGESLYSWMIAPAVRV
jgi:hypothetical protein